MRRPADLTTRRSGRRRARSVPVLIAAGALAVTACSADEPDGPATATGTDPVATGAVTDTAPSADGTDLPRRSDDDDVERQAKVALRRFDDCDAFLDHVHTEGVERVGAHGFDDERYWFDDDVAVMEAGPMATVAMEEEATEAAASDVGVARAGDVTADIDGGEPAAGPDGGNRDLASETGDADADTFSGTNVQVDGVDEPDIVKTDGRRILAITGNRLVYVAIDDTGRAGERRGDISLSDESTGTSVHGQELLMSGDRAFVVATVEGGLVTTPVPDVILDDADPDADEAGGGSDTADAESEFAEDPIPIEPLPSRPFPIEASAQPRTVVIEVDVANPDDLRIVNTLTVDGRYVSARSIGDTARLVVSTSPTDLGFVHPSGPGSEERAIETNRELVLETTLDDWVPNYTLVTGDGSTQAGELVGCESIHAPSEFAGFDMLSVLTLPMDASLGSPTATTSIMATGDTVYSSQDRMYVSTNEWVTPTFDDRERGAWEETYQTDIHRFSLPVGEAAEYEASGSVDGHLLNQFSMHDRDGTLFVATTTGTPWSTDGSESQIVSMQANGDRLEQIGVVGGIGEGEQIFSVRYVADTAYVVTFRQTDPFYVVDLTAPTDMVVRGELKIPGVSTYLHPISDSLVLGVGQERTDDGRLTGSKVTLFDVSDPSAPREVDVWSLANSDSDAEFDHRAFLWWAPTSTAVLPLVSWNDQFAGAVVLNVTADGITEQGRVTHVEPDDDVARTDCRELTVDEVPDESFGDLFWFVREPNASIGLCGSDDVGSIVPVDCDVIPVADIRDRLWIGDAGEFPVDLEGVERIEVCWSSGFDGYDRRIVRTMVIGDQLWTLAPTTLQANDLATLDRTTRLTL